MNEPKLTIEEFAARFMAHMLKCAGEKFDDGASIAEYAEEIASSYFEDYRAGHAFGETPEDCADSDMSYWGDD